jgi:inner membrane protein
MTEELGKEWGRKQTIAGVFLMVPVYSLEKYYDDELEKEDKRYVTRKLVILPEELNVKIHLNDEVRQRGIYKTAVYTADIILSGTFPSITLPDGDVPENLEAGLGIRDTKSIMKIEEFIIEEENIELESGTGLKAYGMNTGISGAIKQDLNRAEKIRFSVKLSLRGSEGIDILPFGKNNHFEISSPWKSPKFYGILPNSKIIDETGFKAEWEVSSFVRNYKQVLGGGSSNEILSNEIREVKIGVDLYEGVTHYRQVMRAVKYSMLFIMLSLFVVYCFEVISKRFTHYVQYGVVGFSLTLFYLVLLSMSEYFSFGMAYIIAALMVIIPNSLYIKAVTANDKYGLGMFVFLSGIYAVLYSILKMEQYALMTGTLLLVIVLYVIMYLTRHIEIIEEK